MTKRESLEAFTATLPVMDYAEMVEISRILLKVVNRATLDGELAIEESNQSVRLSENG